MTVIDLTFAILLVVFIHHIISLSLLRFSGRWSFSRLVAAFDFNHHTLEHGASDTFISVAGDNGDPVKVDL